MSWKDLELRELGSTYERHLLTNLLQVNIDITFEVDIYYLSYVLADIVSRRSAKPRSR
jgi:hypothetical protein